MAEEATLDQEAVVAPEIKPVEPVKAEPIVGKSEVDPGKVDTKTVDQHWRDDWRELVSPDAKHQKTLSRFSTPKELFNSYESLRQKLSSGELKANVPFPVKGTAEEQTAWRKEQGLPEAPDKYDLKFDNGLVVGEADKPFIDAFLKDAHANNMKPEAVKTAVSWYYKALEERQAKQAESDEALLQETSDALRAEWGSEFPRNRNLIRGLLETAPPEVKEQLEGARLANGQPLFANADAIRAFANWARQINPVATVVPGMGANMASAVEDEIAAIEKTMRTDRRTYNKDEKMQARYRELLGARDRLKK